MDTASALGKRHLVDQDVVLAEVAVHEAALLVQLAHQQDELRVHALQPRQGQPRILRSLPTSLA